MGRFDRDNGSRRGRDFGRRGYDDRGSGRTQMHQAVCSNCGKTCEVPFRPNGSKPVYCSDCFQNNRGSDSRNFDSRNSGENFRRPRFENNREYGNKDKEHDNYSKQFAQLNAKLDTILTMLKPSVSDAPQDQKPAAPAVEETKAAEEVVVATVTEVAAQPQEEEQAATPAKKKKVTKKKTAAKKE